MAVAGVERHYWGALSTQSWGKPLFSCKERWWNPRRVAKDYQHTECQGLLSTLSPRARRGSPYSFGSPQPCLPWATVRSLRCVEELHDGVDGNVWFTYKWTLLKSFLEFLSPSVALFLVTYSLTTHQAQLCDLSILQSFLLPCTKQKAHWNFRWRESPEVGWRLTLYLLVSGATREPGGSCTQRKGRSTETSSL